MSLLPSLIVASTCECCAREEVGTLRTRKRCVLTVVDLVSSLCLGMPSRQSPRHGASTHLVGVGIVLSSVRRHRGCIIRVVAAAPLSCCGHAITSVVVCCESSRVVVTTSGCGDAGTPHCDRPNRGCVVRRARDQAGGQRGYWHRTRLLRARGREGDRRQVVSRHVVFPLCVRVVSSWPRMVVIGVRV